MPQYFFVKSFPQIQYFQPVFSTIPAVFPVKVTYKTSTKKNAKTQTKKLTYTMKVNNSTVALSGDSVVAVGDSTQLTTTKKASTRATVAYTSSDDAIATVAADGTVTGVKAGKATITATLTDGKVVSTATQEVEVKKAILTNATQTEYNKIEAVIVGDTKDIKPSDIKITNTATKAAAVVKSVSAKKGTDNTFVIETFTSMTDAKEYTVEYADSTAVFTATDNTVAKVALTKTEVPAGIKTEIKAVTKDANNVILGYFDLTNPSNAKGQVTTALTITKGYVQGSDVYLPAVGDTMVAKLTYHTGSYATDGKETGIIEDTATITAVDPSTVSYNYAVTIGTTAPVWKAASFKANTAIKVGATGQNAYFRITDDKGNDVSDYNKYSVETADPTKLVVNATDLSANGSAGTTGVSVKGVAAGDTYILVKKDNKVVFSLPVSVQGKETATSVDLNKTSVSVMSGSAVTETIEARLKNQYSENMVINTTSGNEVKVENLSKPDGATAPTFSVVNGKIVLSDSNKKVSVNVKGTDFATAGKLGTYTYKITMKDSDKKEVVRTFTINLVESATVQAYQLSLPSEVDTTVTKDTTVGNKTFKVNVVKMANGAAIGDYTATSGDSDTDVTYTVKDATGKDVDSAYVNVDSKDAQAINVTTVSDTAISGNFQKTLTAGTYYVTAKFKVVEGSAKREVVVSGSFTIKDTQDIAAGVNVKKNDLDGNTLTAAFDDTATTKTYVEVTYDGIVQNLNGKIHQINATKAGNTAYVTSVEVFVNVTGSSKYVLITVPVNQTFTNVDSANEALIK